MFNEKSSAVKTHLVIALLIVLTTFVFWSKAFAQVKHDPVFVAGLVIGALLYLVLAIRSIRKADDPRVSNAFHILVVIVGVAVIIWSCGWLSTYSAKTKEGIQYQYKK